MEILLGLAVMGDDVPGVDAIGTKPSKSSSRSVEDVADEEGMVEDGVVDGVVTEDGVAVNGVAEVGFILFGVVL